MLTVVLIGNSSTYIQDNRNGDPEGIPRSCPSVIRDQSHRIGMTGFEPAAPSSRTKCATKLRYIPVDPS